MGCSMCGQKFIKSYNFMSVVQMFEEEEADALFIRQTSNLKCLQSTEFEWFMNCLLVVE